MPSRFQLRGSSIEALQWRLMDTYGTRARIVHAERIQVGGLFGFGATTTYEVTVEVDGPPSTPAVRRPSGSRKGLSALLAEADGSDTAFGAPPAPVIATESADFEAMLDNLSRQLEVPPREAGAPGALELLGLPAEAEITTTAGDLRAGTGDLGPAGDLRAGGDLRDTGDRGVEAGDRAPAGPAVPRVAAGPGDLVILVGLRDQPLLVAQAMARTMGPAGAKICSAGEFRAGGLEHVLVDGPSLRQSQAMAAIAERPLLVALSLGASSSSNPFVLASAKPDQLWLVVDAAHKPADTKAWVQQVAWYAGVDAVAVTGSRDTATPETVNELGYPIGWLDGRPASRPTL